MKIPAVLVSVLLIISAGCNLRDRSAVDDIEIDGDTLVMPYRPMPTGQWRSVDCEGVDSLEVTYMCYACDCPAWLRQSSLERAAKDTLHTSYADLDSNSYWLEPACNYDTINKIQIPWMHVMLYGRLDTALRYPKNTKFTDPDPRKGKVFIYCGYRIIDKKAN